MNVLGINGLGVTPSACLMIDGRLVALAEEERFNRLKGAFGMMPEKAAKFCLEFAGLSLDDIDCVAFGWNANRYTFYMPFFFLKTYIGRSPKLQGSSNLYKAAEQLTKYRPGNVKQLIIEMFRGAGLSGKIPPVEFIPHHLAHAASTFYTSGFEDAHILIVDGSGEDACTTILRGNNKEITQLKSYKIPDSLGWFYQGITEYLGFIPNRHEGKVMALASYGERIPEVEDKINQMISSDSTGNYRYDPRYSFSGTHDRGQVFSRQMVKLLGSPRNYKEPISSNHKNIACSTQYILEEIVKKIVKNISSFPDFNGNLCIAGGVGLNCKMNGAVADLDCVNNIFVPPVTSDAGTALGAAMYLSKSEGYDPRFKMEHAYWGPEFTQDQVEETLLRCGVRFTKEPNIEQVVAGMLAQDKVVGWFQGRMEAGSRALGARSILASPINATIKDTVNEKVKGRESWRPFAASILYEEKENFVVNPRESPFMAMAFKVKQEIAGKIPSAIHIDNTTRPQFVKKQVNPRFWTLINEFGKITGVYALLNTSFNTNEEPIVCTPEQALRTFYASGMDYLVIDCFIVNK